VNQRERRVFAPLFFPPMRTHSSRQVRFRIDDDPA
jgi:hypothetical protein